MRGMQETTSERTLTNFACVYCGNPVPEPHSPCCGEVGHTHKLVQCNECHGRGEYETRGSFSRTIDCMYCNGTGMVPEQEEMA